MTARYAIYLSPRPDCAWGRFGAAWLGRCAHDPAARHSAPEGIESAVLRIATAAPRRYGFHATLKAPFRLAAGARCEDLRQAVDRLCAGQLAFRAPPLRAAMLDDFLALVPEASEPRLAKLAAACTRELDGYRAPPDAAEIARRRKPGLSRREQELLHRWGYPHVLDRFRFHLSLTGPLHRDAEAATTLRQAADTLQAAERAAELEVDSVCIFEEPAPGADFRAVHRAPLGFRGRLVYVIGPSGAGKDSVLEWARQRLGEVPDLRFARRTITREARPGGEAHRSVSRAEFEDLRRRGGFAMTWHANDCWYGIEREILDWLTEGKTVVVNGSRAHLPRATAEFPQLEAVHVTAPAPLLRARLQSRGRESRGQIDLRMARNAAWSSPASVRMTEIANVSDIAVAGRALQLLLAPGAAASRSHKAVTTSD